MRREHHQCRTLSAMVDESPNRNQTFYVMAAAVLDDSRARVRVLMHALGAQVRRVGPVHQQRVGLPEPGHPPLRTDRGQHGELKDAE